MLQGGNKHKVALLGAPAASITNTYDAAQRLAMMRDGLSGVDDRRFFATGGTMNAALCHRPLIRPDWGSRQSEPASKELTWKGNDCEREAHDFSPSEFHLLIRAAAAGDREALGVALESCCQALLHAAQHLLPKDLQAKGDASDLVQDTLLEAHRDFSRFQGHEQKELRAWLMHILRNNFYNWTRAYRGCGKRQIAREVSLDDCAMTKLNEVLCVGTPSPSSAAILREEVFSGRRVFDRLPEKYRQVLSLRTGEGWSFKAIGAQFGCTAAAARKTWLRAIEQFRREASCKDLSHAQCRPATRRSGRARRAKNSS